MKNSGYTKHYFLDRDQLDLHTARVLEKLIRDHNTKTVLDVGCGTGRLIEFLKKKKINIVGCDISKEAVKIARAINGSKIIFHSSGEKLPFPSRSFDLVISISMIEHLNSIQSTQFLRESYRVLKKGGYIFIVTPNFNSPLRFFLNKKWFGYSDPTHIQFFTTRSLSKQLRFLGFQNVVSTFKIDYDMPFGWPLPNLLKHLPQPFHYLLNFLLISTPLSSLRDSFWMGGKK